MTIQQLEQLIAEKRAYGVKTVRLENELYQRKRAAMPAYRRRIQDGLTTALIVVASVILWGLTLLPIIVKALSLFNG